MVYDLKLIERRFKGDFWTPIIWAKQADQLMQEVIDSNYKENSIVWDCAAGVRNLTREFNYNDLYISTYHQDEVYLGEGYNPEAKAAFQYDFLNDDVSLNPKDNPNPNDWKMPNSLFNALKEASKTGKRIIFILIHHMVRLIMFKQMVVVKKVLPKTKMNEQMIDKG